MNEDDDFYPLLLKTKPPKLLTREMVDEYYRKRGTTVKILHIPATKPRDEGGAQSGPQPI